MTAPTVPLAWRALIHELNGGRIPDGTPGIRDVDAPCEMFDPGEPGAGTCLTDGHYICSECVHINVRELRRRQDRCEDCGEKLRGDFCPPCDSQPVGAEVGR